MVDYVERKNQNQSFNFRQSHFFTVHDSTIQPPQTGARRKIFLDVTRHRNDRIATDRTLPSFKGLSLHRRRRRRSRTMTNTPIENDDRERPPVIHLTREPRSRAVPFDTAPIASLKREVTRRGSVIHPSVRSFRPFVASVRAHSSVDASRSRSRSRSGSGGRTCMMLRVWWRRGCVLV